MYNGLLLLKKLHYSLLAALLLASEPLLAEGLVLSSPEVSGQLSLNQVFNGFGCSGKNLSPRLDWANAPENTKSYAITVYDPDAPTGSGWWHWIIFDIPASVHTLETGAGNVHNNLAPKGAIQSVTSFAHAGYGGACPPQGDRAHQYIFTVYALKVESLALDSSATPAMVGFYLNKNALAKASVIAYYGR